MRQWKSPTATAQFLGIAIVACLLSALPHLANAQGQGAQGENAVYPASGNCCVGSAGFIDASMFAGNPPQHNICAILNWVLNPVNRILPATGAIIDARGLPGLTGTSMQCTASPWSGITTPPPSVILLPAGNILIPTPWVLPNNTTVIGEGDDTYMAGTPPTTTFATTLQACKSSVNTCSFSGTDMIDLGSSACNGGCTNISVEHLALDAQGQSLNGIVNANAQAGSHVDHVSLYQILGTGLWLEGNASDSGPYSNITFDTGGFSGLGGTVCASINGLSGTRGIHGLSCNSETNDANAAVLLDSSNNSIEDVRIVGFYDGIDVGANANAQSNVLVNIIGDTNTSGPCPIKVVHIFNSGNTVTDLSAMGIANLMEKWTKCGDGQNAGTGSCEEIGFCFAVLPLKICHGAVCVGL
jgi:hypothetical protein